ncbi:MAG: glycosyltransferase family 4 protein [Dermatophilaceae bacterium]
MTSPKAVLMLVGNDIRNDTRVLKTAQALSEGGLDVTVMGYASAGVREESELGRVRLLLVPVPWVLRDRATARRQTSHALLSSRVSGLARLETAGWRLIDGLRNRSPLRAGWRQVLPEILDYEVAFAPVIDALQWDVLHAHDVHLVGVASRAVERRRARGIPASWVYDAHEFVAGLSVYGSRTRRKVAAYLSLESEYIGSAVGVLTVTQPLAEELQRRYELPTCPTVVMNSPVLAAGSGKIEVDLRTTIGLTGDVPLMVYSGAITAARGIQTAVAALPDLPGVHLALVCVPNKAVPQAARLLAQATVLGVADRLHLVDPVRPEEVSAFVAGADVGLLPLRHFGSHEMALANKLFEYLYAGVPVLVSDCRAQADFVRRHGVGAVHIADDATSFATELRGLLARRAQLAQLIAHSPDLLEPYAWERQETALRAFYDQLPGS